MLKKLRRKFITVTMAIVCAMLIIIFALVYHFTRQNLNNQTDNLLTALSTSDHLPAAGNGQTTLQMPWFALKINIWGDVIATGSSYFDLQNEAFLQELIGAVYDANETSGYLENYHLRYMVSNDIGTQRIVFVDISGQLQALNALMHIIFATGTLSVVLFLGLSIWLARWAVKPVEQAWQQQRQFVSDASHELKTPLTVIRSNAQMLQESCDEETKQSCQSIVTMADHMRKLVDGLLELARADAGQVRKAFSRVNLSRLTEQAALPFEPVFFEKNIGLECQVKPDIYCVGSSQHLQQVVDILLDNALKYSDAGTVRLALESVGKNQCLLMVDNPGAPIDKQELERIFERFYRADAARSRDGSFGLGLSIARAIVLEHRGKIWAQSSDGRNRFCVLLPMVG